MQLLSTLDLALRRWQRYGEVRRELATYTDRELEDMGLSRSDIPHVAREAAAMVRRLPKVLRPSRTSPRLSIRNRSHQRSI